MGELAHVARVMTMGAIRRHRSLTRINQPLAAILAEGDACQRWLAGSTPKLDEARESVGCIIRDGSRARDIIKRIQSAGPEGPLSESARLNVNDVIREESFRLPRLRLDEVA